MHEGTLKASIALIQSMIDNTDTLTVIPEDMLDAYMEGKFHGLVSARNELLRLHEMYCTETADSVEWFPEYELVEG